MLNLPDVLFDHPVLFSNKVNASTVETLFDPEHTSKATIADTVVPTNGFVSQKFT